LLLFFYYDKCFQCNDAKEEGGSPLLYGTCPCNQDSQGLNASSGTFERDLIDDQQAKTTKISGQKGACKSVSWKERAEQAEGGEGELGMGESAELPRHMSTGGGKQWCCLEWLLSEQHDFKKQENAVREYIKSRGHGCIFLPKSRPGIC
jgi:hypothetical protein